MNRPRALPVWIWMPLTWLVHGALQAYGWYVIMLPDEYAKAACFCLFTLVLWAYREWCNLCDAKAKRPLTWIDWLDTVGDLAGPVAVTIYAIGRVL